MVIKIINYSVTAKMNRIWYVAFETSKVSENYAQYRILLIKQCSCSSDKMREAV